MELEMRLALAARDFVRTIERFRVDSVREHAGIGTTEMVALGHLYVDGPLTASELAAELSITSASATELVDRIEGAGYAVRSPHPTDRRKRLVALTERGRDTVAEIYRDLGSQLNRCYAPLTAHQQKGVDSFLAGVSAALSHGGGAADRIGHTPGAGGEESQATPAS